MQTITVPTAIRVAFDNIQVKKIVQMEEAKRIASIVHNALSTNVGFFKRPAVSLNVTTPTYKQMVRDGVIVQGV